MAGTGLVGLVGTVVTRIRGAQVPGEVLLVSQGSRELYTAYSADPIDVGAPVLVVQERAGVRQVDVVPWDIPGLDTSGVAGPQQ